MRIALCFWGLQRSTQYTYKSIYSCILLPLKQKNIQVDIYVHSTTVTHYVNYRSKETITPSPHLWKFLKPNFKKIESQEEVDQRLHLEDYRTFGCPWNSPHCQTLDNLVRSLYSLKEVTLLMEQQNINYDFVMYCRPDVIFQTRFSPSFLSKGKNHDSIVLVDFGKYPVNDRFALCRPNIAHIYGFRFDKALDYSRHFPLHSENFLHHILTSHQIRIEEIHFVFYRVRSDGRVQKDKIGKGGI